MSVEDLYIALSARVTAAVVNHQTLDWTNDFNQLREVIRRVTGGPTNADLTTEEKVELTRRLLALVDDLERTWPNLRPK
jgi:hypothetical protein